MCGQRGARRRARVSCVRQPHRQLACMTPPPHRNHRRRRCHRCHHTRSPAWVLALGSNRSCATRPSRHSPLGLRRYKEEIEAQAGEGCHVWGDLHISKVGGAPCTTAARACVCRRRRGGGGAEPVGRAAGHAAAAAAGTAAPPPPPPRPPPPWRAPIEPKPFLPCSARWPATSTLRRGAATSRARCTFTTCEQRVVCVCVCVCACVVCVCVYMRCVRVRVLAGHPVAAGVRRCRACFCSNGRRWRRLASFSARRSATCAWWDTRPPLLCAARLGPGRGWARACRACGARAGPKLRGPRPAGRAARRHVSWLWHHHKKCAHRLASAAASGRPPQHGGAPRRHWWRPAAGPNPVCPAPYTCRLPSKKNRHLTYLHMNPPRYPAQLPVCGQAL